MNSPRTPSLASAPNGHVQHGFTLLELVIGLAVLALLLQVGASGLASLQSGWRLSVTAAQMQSHLNLTRSEAMKRNARVAMCKSADGETCAAQGGWEQGWMVFHDANNSGTRDPGEAVVARYQVSGSVRVLGNAPVSRYVSYSGGGNSLLVNGGFQAGTITLCTPSAGATQATLLVINSTGRVRARKSEVAHCA